MKHKARPGRSELRLEDLTAIVERAKAAPLGEADYTTLKAAVETLAFLTQELEGKGTTIERLRKLLFGASTEKTSQVLGENPAGAAEDPAAGATSEKPRAPGHGKNGAAAYRGAQKVKVPHEKLHRGDVGTVVRVYKNGAAYEVEFVDGGGATIALISLAADAVRPIRPGEVLHARRTA